jgi:hypothetical protein
MCKLGDPAAVPPLTEAARDATFPDIQAAAVAGLGCFCPRGFDRLLAEASRSDHRQVALAAAGARERCQKRGSPSSRAGRPNR